MIEQQSENIINKEENISEESNPNEDPSLDENKSSEDKELTEESKDKINADDFLEFVNDSCLKKIVSILLGSNGSVLSKRVSFLLKTHLE